MSPLRDAIDHLIDAQLAALRGSLGERLYGDPRPMEVVLGRMEAEAIIADVVGDPYTVKPKTVELSVLTYLGMRVIVEDRTGVKVRRQTAEPSTVFEDVRTDLGWSKRVVPDAAMRRWQE